MDQTSRKTRIPELVRIKPLLGFEPYQYSLNLKLTAPHQLYFCDGWMDGWMDGDDDEGEEDDEAAADADADNDDDDDAAAWTRLLASGPLMGTVPF